MQKKNLSLRIAAVLMVTALFAGCILSGTTTLAKYAAAATALGEAEVAKWSITIDGEDIAETANVIAEIEIDLLDTIKDSDGGTETDVADDLIAPGTKGNIAGFTVTNDSDVTAKISVVLTALNLGGIPLKINGGAVGALPTLPYTVKTAASVAKNGGELELAASDFTWEWPFSDGTSTNPLGLDAADLGYVTDTPIGVAGTAKMTATFKVVAVQVD